MGKLTAQQIDERISRVVETVQRAHDRGDITYGQMQTCGEDLARWAFEEYSRLPGNQGTEAILRLLRDLK